MIYSVSPRSQKRSGPTGVVFLLVALFMSGISGFDRSQIIRFYFYSFALFFLEHEYSETEVTEHRALLIPPWHFESAEITRRGDTRGDLIAVCLYSAKFYYTVPCLVPDVLVVCTLDRYSFG